MSKARKQYSSDLREGEWRVLRHLVPVNSGAGRKMTLSIREVLNAIFYIAHTGCQWRNLPGDFPNWQSVYYHYYRWMKRGIWQKMHTLMCQLERQRGGRKPNPTAGVIDTQSVKTTALAEERGFDGFKHIKGHKRHIITDTDGNLLQVAVQNANMADCKGAPAVIEATKATFPTLHKLWADRGYQGNLIADVQEAWGIELEIVKRERGQRGFQLLPRRWVAERTFGWFEWYRRLSRDYERLTRSSEGMIYVASLRILLKRQLRKS